VIAVLSVLISILQLSLRKALGAAKTLSCSSNLKQIAQSQLLQIDDEDGNIPYMDEDKLSQISVFANLVRDNYLSGDAVLLCPGDISQKQTSPGLAEESQTIGFKNVVKVMPTSMGWDVRQKEWYLPATEAVRSQYTANGTGCDHNWWNLPFRQPANTSVIPWVQDPITSGIPKANLSRMSNPSLTWMHGDGEARGFRVPIFRHSRLTFNASYFDGHVNNEHPEDMELLYSGGSIYDERYLFNKYVSINTKW
jgi:prepilin-type processing-associated H-X9-DG protein